MPEKKTGVPRLIAGVLFVLTSLLFVEQSILRHRPYWLARWGFVPLVRRALSLSEQARARLRSDASGDAPLLDPRRLDWPAGWSDDEVDVTPPSAERAGWMRVHSVAGKRFAGVARMAVAEEQGTLVVRVHYYPATLAFAVGTLAILIALILALAPLHVGIILSVIVVVMWLMPSLSWLQTARARLTRAVEDLAEKIERPPEPERKKKRGKR